MLMQGGDDRFQTMSLQSTGSATIPNRTIRLREKETNRTSDIEGCTSEMKHTRYIGRRPDLYATADIEGSSSTQLHREFRAKPDYSLMVSDIDYAQPRPLIFKTKRETNPLNPEYKLASCVPAPAVEPKFIRDAFNVADIEGTCSKSRFRFAQRDSYDVMDIEGAQSGWKPRHQHRLGTTDNMSVRDINDTGFKSQRVTDPLRPTYRMNGMTVADDMVKTRPRTLPKQHDGPNRSLYTKDIEGANGGWKPPHEMQPPLEKRRQFRNTNYITDILGAQSDTVKHSISTTRATNPLNPAYQGLDGDLLPDPTKPDYSHLLPTSTPDRLVSRGGTPRATSTPDRMVLVSRDGVPRVPTERMPSRRQTPKERQTDIDSVRALS